MLYTEEVNLQTVVIIEHKTICCITMYIHKTNSILFIGLKKNQFFFIFPIVELAAKNAENWYGR